MSRYTGSWERPIQGVSQQSDKDRIDGQCTLQENMIPSPLYGLIKRVGTRNISKLLDSVSEDALWYSYNRGGNESFIILIEPNSAPRVFDKLGNEKTVNVTDADLAYYSISDPKGSLRISTIADFSFILNTDVVVETLDELSPVNPNMAIVYCQFANYGRDYSVSIGGVELASYTTPDGSTSSHVNQIKTNFIIQTLADQINGISVHSETLTSNANNVTLSNTPTNILSAYNITKDSSVAVIGVAGNTVSLSGTDDEDVILITYDVVVQTDHFAEVYGNVMYITQNNGESFGITTVDSADGNDLIAVQDAVTQTSNLPPKAPSGYVVKVQGAGSYDAAAYWLKAVPNTEGEQTGSDVHWEETVAQGTKFKLDLDTMPLTLISEADGTFTLGRGTWEDRRVGEDNTNPFPSFVGFKVNSIGTFQNRILFTSEEAAIFSRSSRFFDFFRETTQTESDADPIDVYADASEINTLLHHAVLDGDIMFFAKNGQFLIKGDSLINSASGIVFKKVTSYPMNVEAEPAVTGESLMFTFTAGAYAGIREMFTDSLTDTKRARPITEHVAEYIEGVPTDMIASPNINTLLVKTDTSDNELYVYDWLWSGENKVQAAMHKWILGGTVHFAKFIEDQLYMVISRDDGVYLEQMPISNDADDDGLDFPVSLDRRDTVTATWTGSRWEFPLTYPVDDIDSLVAVRGNGCWEEDKGVGVFIEEDSGTYYTTEDLADTNITTECTLTIGIKFKSRYQPTQPFIKDQNGRTIGLDRLTIGKVSLNYEKIGNIKVIVSDKRSRRDWEYSFNGRYMNNWNNRVGFAPLDSGRFQFPVRLPTSVASFIIETDDYRPFTLRDMEWEGTFTQRGRRI